MFFSIYHSRIRGTVSIRVNRRGYKFSMESIYQIANNIAIGCGYLAFVATAVSLLYF